MCLVWTVYVFLKFQLNNGTLVDLARNLGSMMMIGKPLYGSLLYCRRLFTGIAKSFLQIKTAMLRFRDIKHLSTSI